MENVTKRGFKVYNKMDILPLDHFLVVMQNLAHFHGRWLAYRWLGEAGKLPQGAWSPDCFKESLNTQKRIPKFVYRQLLNGSEKTIQRILELEGKTEYLDRNERLDKCYYISSCCVPCVPDHEIFQFFSAL